MSNQHIKFGLFLLAIQIVLLMVTMSFHSSMDRIAEKNGIAEIITEAGK